jgi:hypothetical protein
VTDVSSDTMVKPGDVVIDEITLKSYTGFTMSLKGIFQNFIVYEDIFSNCMSGSITLIDSMNIVKNFPIIGAETLTIIYRTPMGGGQPVKLVFRTYKISVLTETAQESAQMVRIEFVATQAIKSMQSKVSKSYRNMPVSKMVTNIFDEYLAVDNGENNGLISAAAGGAAAGGLIGSMIPMPIAGGVAGAIVGGAVGLVREALDDDKIHLKTVTETFDNRSYVIPYWSPLYAINWLAHLARAKTDTSMCDYVLFQNSDGHHFVPLSGLKTADAAFTYTNYPDGFRSDDGARMLESELRNIHSLVVEDMTDKIKQQNLGMLASAIMTHDMTTKTWSITQFKYDKSFMNDAAHLEKNPLIPMQKIDYTDSVESHIRFYPNSSYSMTGLVQVQDPDETVLLRQSLLNQMNSINLIVSCYGDTNVKVGQVINFRTIAKEATKKQDNYEDDYLKGRYLVTTVKHLVTDREHTMTMTLSRDSFAEPIADYKKAELNLEPS